MARLNDTEAIRNRIPGGAPRGGAVGDAVSFEGLAGQLAGANTRLAPLASRAGFVTGRALSKQTGSGPERLGGANEELHKPYCGRE